MSALRRRQRPKRTGPQANVNALVGPSGTLLHVVDELTKQKWLVDGGAIWSIIPPTHAQRLKGPIDTPLKAANGTDINCYGRTVKTIRIGKRDFTFEFIVAAVERHILGADFLAEFYLAPNHRDGTLLDLSTPDLKTFPASIATNASTTHVNLLDEQNSPYYQLLDSFPSLSTPTFTLVEVKHGVKHHIPTEGRPVQARARRLDPEKLAVAKAELEKLCELGICHRGKSEWSSPLLVTTKPDGGWRVCGDYRRVNDMTKDDRYPVRNLQDFNVDLAGKTIFSKVDLLKGYHQIPVADEDIGKTAVITPFGLFIFPRTPFGLKNAGQDFQRLMDEILGDIPRTFVYLDDVLVASENPEQHLGDLRAVFEALETNGLVVNRKKCILGVPELEFLGFKVNSTGTQPLPDRVASILEYERPKSIKDLQRFLGVFGYYRRFVPKAAHLLYPLFDAMQGVKKPKTGPKPLIWSDTCEKAFKDVKQALADATLLHHPKPGATIALTTDASNFAIGGVLEQRGTTGWEPIAFFSKKLQPRQRNWPPYDRELLAAHQGVRYFKEMVEGRPFTLYTDHQSLVPSMSKKTDPQTLRQQYQLACISEYTTDIRYIQGKSNVVADALSRPPTDDVEDVSSVSTATTPTTPEAEPQDRPPDRPLPQAAAQDLVSVVNAVGDWGIDLEEMAVDQPLDQDFQKFSADARSGLNFKKVDLGRTQLIVDISNGPARPFVPYSWRKRVFETIHNLGHPGVERTRQTVASKFYWPTLRADTSKWARECLSCQQAKVTRHTTPAIGEFVVPEKRFSHVNVDLVGPLPASNGFKYLLTAVDRFTRWPMAIPIADIQADTVMDAFALNWIANFGVPSSITTDRGSQFSSAIWQQLLQTWGIKSHQTTAYHPAANGLVERLHRRLKEALMAVGEEANTQWFWRLPCVLLSIRTTLKPDINASPADLVYGEGLAVPGGILPTTPASDAEVHQQQQSTLGELRLEVARLQPTQTSAHRRPHVHIPEDLQTATHVFVKRGGVQPALSTPYAGPYRILARGTNTYKLSIPGRGAENVALERLKPAVTATDDAGDQVDPPTPPSPNRPGRPPGPRTRIPEPTDRRTRNRRPVSPDRDPPVAADADASRNTTSRRRIRFAPPQAATGSDSHPQPTVEPEAVDETPQLPSTQPTAAAEADFDPMEGTSSHSAPVPGGAGAPEERPRRTLSFSRPTHKNFSYRRPRPNINLIASMISSHLCN